MDGILKILKKENGPRALSAPALELNTIIFKHVYWYVQQISGERLQDHWSSGFDLGPPLNDVVKPLSWLLGKWQSVEALGYYPTIKDFKYEEELEFTHVGQPNIQFR